MVVKATTVLFNLGREAKLMEDIWGLVGLSSMWAEFRLDWIQTVESRSRGRYTEILGDVYNMAAQNKGISKATMRTIASELKVYEKYGSAFDLSKWKE